MNKLFAASVRSTMSKKSSFMDRHTHNTSERLSQGKGYVSIYCPSRQGHLDYQSIPKGTIMREMEIQMTGLCDLWKTIIGTRTVMYHHFSRARMEYVLEIKDISVEPFFVSPYNPPHNASWLCCLFFPLPLSFSVQGSSLSLSHFFLFSALTALISFLWVTKQVIKGGISVGPVWFSGNQEFMSYETKWKTEASQPVATTKSSWM
jgi:hypothetical protein